MNIRSPSPRIRTAIFAVCGVALSVALRAPFCRADELLPETRSHVVKFDGLDLSRGEGRKVARERIHNMARLLCTQMADREDLSRDYNYKACVAAAMSPALVRLASIIDGHDRQISRSTAPANSGQLNESR